MTNYGLNNTVISTGQRVTFASAYTLDGVGNRTQVDLTEPLIPSFPPEEAGYSYNVGNILTSADGATYTHDANGNRTRKTDGTTITTYTYDPLNRFVQVADGSKLTQYIYNGLGQRTAKIENGVRTNYLIDPNCILPQVVAETDNTGNLIAYYVYDGVGLVAKVTPQNQYYFYHYDGLGSTIAITDNAGHVVNSYAYSPEGLVGAQETIPNAFKYVGRFGVMDEGNGLYFMRARYYDPEVGRFINKDPIGYEGGDVNLYAYIWNNPTNLIDPLGLGFWSWLLPDKEDLCIIEETDWSEIEMTYGVVIPMPIAIGAAYDFLPSIFWGGMFAAAQPPVRYDPKDLGPLVNAPGMPGWRHPPNDPMDPDFMKEPPDYNKWSKWKKFKWQFKKFTAKVLAGFHNP